ncbi:MAG: hypothetical protein WCD67_11535, partial [Xanthobacteraceae bacterium]
MMRLELPRPVTTTLRSFATLRHILTLAAPIGLALLFAGAPVQAAPQEDVEVSHFVLANGLEVVVIPDHR